MGGALGARDDRPATLFAFQESPGGGTLRLGRLRHMRGAIAGGGFFMGIGLLVIYLSLSLVASADASRAFGIQLSGLLFFGFGAVFVLIAVLDRGPWLLRVDDQGIHLLRSHRRPRDVAWNSVKRVQYGPTVISTGRYSSSLGDGIRIDVQHSLDPIFLDTVHFRVPADDMDRLAEVLKVAGGVHGFPVEPFPMEGRDIR